MSGDSHEILSSATVEVHSLPAGILPIQGCTVIWVDGGAAIVKVNHNRLALRRGCLGVLFYDDEVVVERVSRCFRCQKLQVPYSAVEPAFYKATTSSLWNFIYRKPIFLVDRVFWEGVDNWWRLVQWSVAHLSGSYRGESIKNLLHNLLMAIDTHLPKTEGDIPDKEDNRSRRVINDFLSLVALHHRDHRDVQWYADRLSIHTSYLYKLTQRVLTQHPKSIIDRQVLGSIKSLLVNTDHSVKTIASELNFRDASYMCRFFARFEDVSPQEFRQLKTSK
ncbi:MAG: helix-turn-helix transcriptional regulator [Bacteroidales bacterium]|nr:helix-turn-helix transcriptional regulator [Bacteroidales bacterium]